MKGGGGGGGEFVFCCCIYEASKVNPVFLQIGTSCDAPFQSTLAGSVGV